MDSVPKSFYGVAAICILVAALCGCYQSEPPGALPELDYEVPLNAYVGQTVIIDASATKDPEGPIDWFLFDFGDGSGAVRTHSPVIDHAYSSSGSFLLSVSAVDLRGNKFTELRSIAIYELGEVDHLSCLAERPYCPPYYACDLTTLACLAAEVYCWDDSDCPTPLMCRDGLCYESEDVTD